MALKPGDKIAGKDQYGRPCSGVVTDCGSDYVIIRDAPYRDIAGQWVVPDSHSTVRQDQATILETGKDRAHRLQRAADAKNCQTIPKQTNTRRQKQ